MAVRIGHASIDENGKVSGGKAGDQSGKEVCTRNWYNKPWTSVIRPKNSNIAEKIAKCMEQACTNNNIGYNQKRRTTLWDEASKVNFDLSKITVKCDCDCSSLVSVCVRSASIFVSKNIYTGNELQVLNATGNFNVFTSSDYTRSDAKLKRGDILLGTGHTAIVLSDGATTIKQTTSAPSSSIKIDSAQKFDKNLVGTYRTTANLNLRVGAGTNKSNIIVIPNGTKVKNYGYYSVVGGTKWLLIQVKIKGKTYTGFSSIKYMIKQ